MKRLLLFFALLFVACQSAPSHGPLGSTVIAAGAAPTGAAGGALSGSYPNPGLLSDAGILNGLAAGGDLSGTYPNPTAAKVNGTTVPAGGALTTGNVLQVSGAGADTYAAVNLAGGANFVTGALPNANQAAQTCTGDVTGNTGATVVSQVTGTSPILVQPSAGTTSLSVDTTGAVIGKTASSNIGMRVAPLIGSETSYAGVWVGANATSPTSGNYLWAFPPSGATIHNGTSFQLTGTLIAQGLQGQQSFPLKWINTASAIACSTGGTQTITAAQSATPGLSVTSGTLSSDCTLDFGTNGVDGWYVVDVSGSITLNGHNLIFKNGTQSQTYAAIPAKGLILVWPHGTNKIVTAP